MVDWTGDVESADGPAGDDDGDDSQGGGMFVDNFERMVENGQVDKLNVQTLEDQIDQINDDGILEAAIEVDDRETAQEIYEGRLESVSVAPDELTDDTTETPDTADEDKSEDLETDASEAEGSDEVDEDDDAESEEGEAEGGDESEVADTIDNVADEISSDGADDDVSESETETTDTPDEDDEADQTSSSTQGGLISDEVLAQHAPSAVTRDAAVEADDRWTFLIWGDEGTGKSHVAHTAPAPICVIDTEGKADNLAPKFDKEIVYFEATDYDEAKEALEQSLTILEDVLDEHGVRGTIVVDSMSKLWEWSQQKYVEFAYPTADGPEDVNFQSALQGGDDWKQIKRYHNTKFREPLVESDFHVVMTAMSKDDYEATMKGASGNPQKPDGEKNNVYAVENILRLRTAEDGQTVGDVEKTDRSRLRPIGMEWPEFDDVVDAIGEVVDAEQSDEPVSTANWPFDVVKGRPVRGETNDDGEDQ